MKQKVQYPVFPEGILFDKKDGHYLTSRVNAVFAFMSSVKVSQDEKSGQPAIKTDCSAMVAHIEQM